MIPLVSVASVAGRIRWVRRLAVPIVALTMIVFAAVGDATADDGPAPFRVGFSRKLFSDVNDADAKAAIRVWAQTVAQERQIDMDPRALLFDRESEMAASMEEGSVDAISLTFAEFLEVSGQVETDHWFVTKTAGGLFEEYVVLVNNQDGVSTLADLEGRAIILHDSARTGLALDWLDSQVIQLGRGRGADDFYGEVERVEKISSAVLPVFFGSAVAAVVAESGFKMMCELNPQLRRELRVIARSISLVPAILCFRNDFESPAKARIMTALQELHTTAAGQQVLTLFQSEALVPVDKQTLSLTEKFLLETRRMRDELASTGSGSAGQPAGGKGVTP